MPTHIINSVFLILTIAYSSHLPLISPQKIEDYFYHVNPGRHTQSINASPLPCPVHSSRIVSPKSSVIIWLISQNSRHRSCVLGVFFVIALTFAGTGDTVMEIACMPVQATFDVWFCCLSNLCLCFILPCLPSGDHHST